MQRRKSFFNNELEQRFSLRKYTIGLCSVCLGFVAIGMGNQTVKADTVNDVEKSSTVQENKAQGAASANADVLPESKTNTFDSANAKPNTTPTETKENEAGSVVVTAPKTNTTSTGANANEATPTETKLAKASSAAVNSNNALAQTKLVQAESATQSKVNGTSTETKPNELGSAAANPNVVSTEAKPNTANPASLAKIKPQKMRLAKLVDTKALTESKVATDNQFNFDDWTTQIDDNYLNITGYNGDRSKQIIVPNGADFAKAGKNDKNLQVAIDKGNLADLIVDGVAPKLSNTDGQKIVAKGNDWSGAFSWQYLHDISGLANLDTSNVTNMDEMFCYDSISDLSPLANWNISKVIDMSDMFKDNRISDLSPLANWNTGNVTNMGGMFDRNLISDLSPLANWNTDNVTNMGGMFDRNLISDLSPLANWNTGNVANMRHMFSENKINDLRSLANWNTGNVTNMSNMFYSNRISDLSPLADWNTGKITDMAFMFCDNQISDLNPLSNWNTGKVTDMSNMFSYNQISDLNPLSNWNIGKTSMDNMFKNDPLNATINSQSTLNKFHVIAYKLDNIGALASHNESKTFNDGSQILLDKNVVITGDSATLTFKANSLADTTYVIKIYNPNQSINIQAAALPTALGTTNISYQDNYTIITNNFINTGSVRQNISITAPGYHMPNFAQYESISGPITVTKGKKDLDSINITYQNVSDISNQIFAPYIGDKPYVNNTQNTFYFKPQINDDDLHTSYSFIKSVGLTITVPDDVTIDPDTFIDVVTGKTLKGAKIANNQYQVVLNNTTKGIIVKGLINVPADKLTNGTAHLPGFGMKYTINTYNDKVAPLVATNTSKELSVIPDLGFYHGNLIKINSSKWSFYQNGNEVNDYISQGFTNRFNGVPLEPVVSTQITNGVETFDMPTGVNITNFDPKFNSDVIDHVDYIYTDGSDGLNFSPIEATPKAIRQMKVYFKNGIQSDSLFDYYASGFYLSFDATYPDGTPIKNFDTFNITGSFSCDELGSTDNIKVAQVMLAPTPEITDGMLTDTNQNESNKAPNANNNSISATIRNDGFLHQGHLTNPIFYFKYNELMVPDLSEISASYNNQNKELGSTGLTYIDDDKIHSSIITDSTGQKFIKVQVDGEYYYGDSSGSKSDFNVKIPISNVPDALTATRDWSWYILNNSNEAKTESIIYNSSQGEPVPTTIDGNTLSVGGTGTWQIITAQGFTSGTETQGNLNGGPSLASAQDDHRQDPTHFTIYDSIINATNDAKSDLVSVTNLPSTQDGKSQFDVHMTGKASLINVMTGQAYDANITYSYGMGDNNFITGNQVTDWSKVKSIKVVPNGGAPSMTSLRLVVPVEDETVYDDVGKTIYMSTMTYGEDKANTKYTIKDGFAVPEKSTILPIIIKAGDMASAKLAVQGQATVHTLVHYKNANGKDVYVKLPDQDKTYNELQDTMKRSDYLQSDDDLTIADRGLLPVGMVINYNNPTIRNSSNTYVAGYANNVAAFDKTVKYDFDGDQVIFEGAMPEIVTKIHQAKETIHYVYRDGRTAAPDKVLTSITLKQTGTKNPFTGEITWNTPMADTLNSVDSPEITGYIADKLTVPSYVVTMDSSDKEVTVTYDTDNENADFTYFDDTTNRKLKVVTKSGKSNAPIGYTTTDEINNYEKQGYILVSDDTDGRNLNFNSLPTIDQHYTIHLKHKIENVTGNDTVTRTIHYLYDNGNTAKPDKTQTVSFNETGTKDNVTGKTTWDNDNAQTVDSVVTPSIIGYTPDKSSIDGQTFKFGDQDVEVTVTYHANTQNAKITYIDDTTKTNLDSKNASGKFGQAITFETAPADEIANYEKQGYVFVSNSFNNNKYQADNSSNVFEVHFVHGTKNVSRSDDVKMTVHYVMDDNSKAPSDNKQTVNFTENGIQDLVTKDIDWTPAESQTFKDVDSPVLTGYTPDKENVTGQTVKFGDPDVNVTVHYTANTQNAKITYIDDTTKTNLKSQNTKGKFGQAITFETAPTVEIANYEKQGYVFVSNSFNNNKYQADNSNNVFEVHFVHGTKKVSRNSNVNMTVHYVMDDNSKAPSDSKQTVNFAENGIQDLVTQDIDWTPAESQTFKDVDSPMLTGYTPDQDTVTGQTVNFGDNDINATVTYHANTQNAKIIYIDDTTKTNLKSQNTSGKFGQTITFATAPADEIASYEKQGYVLVSNSFNNNKYQADNSNNVFKVHFIHGTKKVSREHSASFTVHYIYKDGGQAKPDHEQTLSFTENGSQDLVTQKITWTPADSQKFDDVATPVITGYTPDQDKVIGQTANFETDNREVTVTYLPDVQHMTITYIDDTTGKTLHTDKRDGVSDQDAKYTTSDTIKQYEDQHYKFVSDSTKGQDLIFDHDDDANQTYEVHFVHGKHDIDQTTSPKQTIHYVYADGLARQGKAADDNVQQLSFKRDGYNDEVTGTDHWNAWTPANSKYNAVDSPVIQGYTPNKSIVDGSTVNPTDKDIEITVTYNADKQTAHVIYIDDITGKTLHTDKLSGVSDQDAKYTTSDTIKKYENQHYKLVSDSTKGQDLIFDHDDNVDQTYEVHFVHGKHDIDQTTSPKQTIHYVYADGLARQGKAADDNVQQLSFKRDGYNDEVTGIDHWNAWTPANSQYEVVDSPVIQGYTPDKLVVEKSTANPTDQDTEVTVIYSADKQAARVIYIDKTTNATLTSKDLSGKSDEDSEYNTQDTIGQYKSQHYVLTKDETDGKNVVFDHDDQQDQTYYVYFVHDTQKVSRQSAVTSTIDYKFEDGKTAQPTVTQTKYFSENGVKDLVTGKITWDEAKPQKFDDIATKSIVGYTPDKDNVVGSTVKFGDQDIIEHVVYHNNMQKAVITYVDDVTNQTLVSNSQDGKFDHEIKFNNNPSDVISGFEKSGYKLVSSNFKDGTKYKADNKQNEFIVHLTHDKQNVNRQDQVIETIHYVYENGSNAQPDHEQTISFTEDGVKDLVTGKITWDEAKPQKFEDVATPKMTGYTPDTDNVVGSTVKFGDDDVEVTVHYTANAQTATITYIDDTEKKTLVSDKQNGKFNQVITFEHDPAEVVKGLKEKGYELVSDNFKPGIKYQADNKSNSFEVHLKHKTESVTRNGAVTQTIHYLYDDGNTAKPDKIQTVSFNETGTKDDVTGKTTWDNDDAQTVDSVITPSITGYTPDKDKVAGQTFRFGDKDIEVTVRYNANAQTAKITYIDDTEKKTLNSDQQNGKFDHKITFEHDPAEVIKSLEGKGYKLVSNDFKQGIKYQADNKSNNFEVHLVHTYEPVETSQTITETVHYIDANGKPVAPDHVAKVAIEVTGIRDKVTDAIAWNTPSTGHFDEVISPKVPNMTPDKKLIPGRDVQYGDSDITESVVYTPDETPREPEKPNDQGKPNTKTPEKPNKSGNPTSKTSEKPNKSGNPTSKTSEKPNKSGNPTSKTSEKPNKPSKKVSKQFRTIVKTTNTEKPINSRTGDNHVSAKPTAKRELPQTGEKRSTTEALVGMLLASMGIATAIGAKKRKKN